MRLTTLVAASAVAVTLVGSPADPASGQVSNLQVNNPAAVPAGDTDITPSVAAIGNKVLIVWWVRGTLATERVRAAISEDGGATYTDVGWLPALSGDWRWGVDPIVQADPVTSTFFIAAQSTSNATHEAGIVFVTAQIGAGIHWGAPQIVYPHVVPGGTYFIDAFDMHYDASSGWLNLVFRNGWLDPPPLVHVFSTDRGATWSTPTTVQSLPGYTSASPRVVWGFGPLLTYIDRPAYEQGTLYSRRWNLGFEPPVAIGSYRMDGATLPGTTTDFGIGDAPTIAVDRTIYRYQDMVYAAWVASCGFPTWPTPSGTTFIGTEPNDTPAQANVVPANTGWIDGQFSPASEPDYVRLHLEQWQRLIVRATSIVPTCTGCDPTVQIEVMAPDGTHGLGVTPLPQSRMANTATAVLFTAKTSGDYYLRITGDGSVSAYELSLAFSSIANPGLDRRDIWVSTSQNGGTTWSIPSLIGFEQPGYDVANLKLIVANDGRPYLFWQDWSVDEFARLMNVRVTRSSDGGHLWEAPQTISTATTDWQGVSVLGSGLEVGWRLGAATTPMVLDGLAQATDPPTPTTVSQVARAAAALPEDRVHVAWTDGRLGQGDIFATSFMTGFEVDYRTTDTVATPGEYLGLRMALVNKNTLFPQWINTTTPTCNRNWSSIYGSMTFGPGEAISTTPYVVQVPDTAAAGTVFFQGGIDVGPEGYGINTFIHVQSSVGVEGGGTVLAFRAPSPNPASSYTNFEFSLPSADQALLEVYDIRGARVRTLLSGRRESGSLRQGWDLRDDAGQQVANGIYLSRLTVGAWSQTRRIAVLH